jgi:peptidyl-prolyl cis-trans isomerase D
MLGTLRIAASSWVAKILLGILVISFAVWGISGQIFSGPGSAVAKVGDTPVSIMEYRLAYDRQISLLSQQLGSRITREQAQAFGVDNQVLSQLVAGAVLDELADDMGLGVSKDMLARLTASDPAFQGPDGRFDRRRFEFVLSQVGMRPDDYIRNRENAAVRQQIIEAVTDGLKAPDALLKAMALYQGEDRTVDYVVLPRSLVEPIENPPEETLSKWFEEHKADYAAPEYRTISYVKLEPEDIADPSVISDEQAHDYYEKNKRLYTTPEKRTIEQIVFPDDEAAKTAQESTRSGTTFEDLVEAQGKTLDDVKLGTFAKEDIPDKAIAEAAFKLSENEISQIVHGTFGPVLLRVTDIEEAKTRPFDEVKDDIKKRLALDEANRILLDVYDQYEDARAGGATMAEAAKQLKLDMKTVEAVDRTGLSPDGTIVKDIPQSEELLRQAFASEEGVENPPLNTDKNGFIFYEVDKITPARDRSLEEVHEKVLKDWKDVQANARLSEKASEFEKQLQDGKTLEDIAAEVGEEVQIKRGLRRGADDADFGRAGVDAVFGIPKGSTGVFAGPSGDSRVLFKVTEVFEPAGAGPEAVPEEMREAVADGIAGDLLDGLVTQLRDRYTISVNQSALRQALAF